MFAASVQTSDSSEGRGDRARGTGGAVLDPSDGMPLGGYGVTEDPQRMNDITKQKALARLRRITGQLEGVARMIEDDRYCVDVLLQIRSAQAALGQTGKVVLRSHVETCVTDALTTGRLAERKRKIDELMDVFARYGCLGTKGRG